MKIPFTKAHGAKNDFLLTWRQDAPEVDLPALARAICDRHTGVGADGWMLVAPARDADAEASIQLYNSDGSTAEISGNGTRCAAALLVRHNLSLRIPDSAPAHIGDRLSPARTRDSRSMNMGRGEVRDPRYRLPLAAGPREATIVWVGNPQCALAVDDFNFDWRALGAEIESHPAFPDRTNVSFVRRVDQHTIDVRFFERGAGETMSFEPAPPAPPPQLLLPGVQWNGLCAYRLLPARSQSVSRKTFTSPVPRKLFAKANSSCENLGDA